VQKKPVPEPNAFNASKENLTATTLEQIHKTFTNNY